MQELGGKMSRATRSSPASGSKNDHWHSLRKRQTLNIRGKLSHSFFSYKTRPTFYRLREVLPLGNLTDVIGFKLQRTFTKSEKAKILSLWERLGKLNKSFLVKKAFRFAVNAHQGQERASGDPAITHPLSVAVIIFEEFKIKDPITIAATLLHDTLEDTKVTYDDLVNEFGEEIADLVDGITKLSTVKLLSPEIRDEENLKNLILEMAKSWRVTVQRFADRLHNMRTLKYLDEMKRKKIATETLKIYVPLAGLLGLWKVKEELEDLAFKYLFPDDYAKWSQEREVSIARASTCVIDPKEKIKEKLTKAKINVEEIYIRFHTTYKLRMETEKREPDELLGVNNIVVIVPTREDCYSALGEIHAIYKPRADGIRDYITQPRLDFYQAIRTCVVTEKGLLWIRICTPEMNELSNRGIIAHMYDFKRQLGERGKTRLKEWLDEIRSSQKISKYLIGALDRIYVSTPNEDIYDLPRGSTALDFAFRIHTELGLKAKGARVNGKRVPLSYKLKPKDVVEIITSEKPNPELGMFKAISVWDKKGRSKLIEWFEGRPQEENLIRGASEFKRIVEQELYLKFPDDIFHIFKDREFLVQLDNKIAGLTVAPPDDRKREPAENLFYALGVGRLSADQFISAYLEIAKSGWGKKKAKVLPFPLSLSLNIEDRGDLIRNIISLISNELGLDIISMNFPPQRSGKTIAEMEVKIVNPAQVEELLKLLKEIKGVLKVTQRKVKILD